MRRIPLILVTLFCTLVDVALAGGPMLEQQMLYPVQPEPSIWSNSAVLTAVISGVFAILVAIISKVQWDRKVRREEAQRDDLA